MKVQAIGPFQAAPALDLDELEIVSAEIAEESSSTSPVSEDAASGDPTDDQDNRGFVHILDAVAKEELKRRMKTARNKDILYSIHANRKRATLRYQSLSDTETSFEAKGQGFDKVG